MPAVLPVGDTAALFTFGEDVSLAIMARTHNLARALREASIHGVDSVVLGRTSVLAYFNPCATTFDAVSAAAADLIRGGIEVRSLPRRRREIPVVFGGTFGPDLPYVAEYHGIPPDE